MRMGTLTSLQRWEPVGRLTPRERETLALMAEGWSNARICARLFISTKTLERHINSIFVKLRLPPNRAENRRVLAVLHYLDEASSARASSAGCPAGQPVERTVTSPVGVEPA